MKKETNTIDEQLKKIFKTGHLTVFITLIFGFIYFKINLNLNDSQKLYIILSLSFQSVIGIFIVSYLLKKKINNIKKLSILSTHNKKPYLSIMQTSWIKAWNFPLNIIL